LAGRNKTDTDLQLLTTFFVEELRSLDDDGVHIRQGAPADASDCSKESCAEALHCFEQGMAILGLGRMNLSRCRSFVGLSRVAVVESSGYAFIEQQLRGVRKDQDQCNAFSNGAISFFDYDFVPAERTRKLPFLVLHTSRS
jgi:hypothetical protein